MKKIINGRKYDTTTAKLLTTWSANKSYSDFDYYEESLYIKRTGEYFLYGSGNAASPYNRYDGSSWCSGEEIVPLTEDEARRWVEAHKEPECYEEIFGVAELKHLNSCIQPSQIWDGFMRYIGS